MSRSSGLKMMCERVGHGLIDNPDNGSSHDTDPLVERATRLFAFLGQSQQLRSPRVHDLEGYRRDGAVHWLADMPQHAAVTRAGTDDGGLVLTVDRVPRVDPPVPTGEVDAWLDGPVDEVDRAPVLRAERYQSGGQRDDDGAGSVLHLADHPQVEEAFQQYLSEWHAWADQERRDEPVRALYGELFSTYVTASGHPEDLELVVGAGLLTWQPDQHPVVRRHMVVTAASISFDDDNGRLSVAVADTTDPTKIELEMLDPGLVGNAPLVNAVRDDVAAGAGHPLDRDRMGEFARRLVHLLAHDAEYRDDEHPVAPSPRPIAAFAPAVVLRKRTQQGLVEIFRQITDQIAASGSVPEGIRPLVDPDHIPDASGPGGERGDGAVVRVDDDPFLPLPVNDVQLKILQRVDTNAQTLIQGPPGTGKTHTAAVLISHLLAQGKRVLITAHTDRALKEVRAKLPEPIRPLAVSVVGASREDMSDLRVAVERIATTASEHDPEEAERRIREHLDTIDRLRRSRSGMYNALLDAREREVREHDVAGYRGTLAAMARRCSAESDRFDWISEFITSPVGAPPVTDAALAGWHRQLLDQELIDDEPHAARRLASIDELVDPRAFADLVEAETRATASAARFERLRRHHAYAEIHRLSPSERGALADRLRGIDQELRALGQWREPWVRAALGDVVYGRSATWTARRAEMGRISDLASGVLERLGSVTDVRVDGDAGAFERPAAALLHHVEQGNSVKVASDGSAKIGAFTARPIKDAGPFFAHVLVDGSAPTTPRQIRAFLTWLEGSRLLAALDRAWPSTVVIPEEDTLHERLQWHRTELSLLDRLLGLAGELQREDQRLLDVGVSRPHWPDHNDVSAFIEMPEAARAADAAATATRALDELSDRLAEVQRWPDADDVVVDLLDSVRRRDHAAYSVAHQRLGRLHLVRTQVQLRDETKRILDAAAPALASAIAESPTAAIWPERVPDFEAAWNWAVAEAWIAAASAPDVNALQSAITSVDDQIRDQVQQLAAVRAWNHAVAPGRLTRGSRASLEQYAALVRRFGKTGGQYRAQRQAEIRDAMDRCRPAVPVWIMPIYRIADQFRVEPDMFDVVIVDEASQAGLEASFLQYLAPRIVVIGDDKQVSPSAVGVDQQQLRDLGNQYLYDDRFRATWQDPQRSLFDEAKMRFSGMLTLVEHRRCVPEIINFSNRIAYEPDGVRLIPVRQFGADRLEPVRPVFVADGYEKGSSTTRTNPPEIDAVIDRIEKCIADPRYDGLSFGVISLLGGAQAKAIEKQLIERISPEEWKARDLRCGDAADFQGSERDVMFLTMVAAPQEGRRLMALTAPQYVQRYNVAASRAKDQMWVFHSVRLDQLGNTEDMRFQLLDYCYGVQHRASSDDDSTVTTAVPDDVVVPPFDSLFEQRVCNRILDRGYSVVPQYPALGYSIDLVVSGATTRLAIECDGDYWHGPEAYQRDMARQRELERCGWHFVRVLESEFYLDPAGALAPVWTRLSELDIHPSGWTETEPSNGSDDIEEPVAHELPASADPEVADVDVADETDRDSPTIIEPQADFDDDPTVDPLVPSDDELDDDPEPAYYDRGRDAPRPDFEVIAAVTTAPPPAEQPSASRTTPYTHFDGRVSPVDPASPADAVAGLVEIVAAEGPMLGTRLHSVYVRSSGGARVGSQIARALNLAITRAVRRGLLVQEDPLGESGVKPRTFRLPEQPAAIVRERGARTFDQIPPAELALVMASVAEEIGWSDTHAVYRSTIVRYGLNQVGSAIRARLDAVAHLARRTD